jgi:hypothetical protein
MDVNRLAVMKIQASRYAFFSVVSFHFVLSTFDQLATVAAVRYIIIVHASVACIHVGDMPTFLEQAADHTTAGHSSVVCVKRRNLAALIVHGVVGCITRYGMLCAHLAWHQFRALRFTTKDFRARATSKASTT